jgi:hypothetical protein
MASRGISMMIPTSMRALHPPGKSRDYDKTIDPKGPVAQSRPCPRGRPLERSLTGAKFDDDKSRCFGNSTNFTVAFRFWRTISNRDRNRPGCGLRVWQLSVAEWPAETDEQKSMSLSCSRSLKYSFGWSATTQQIEIVRSKSAQIFETRSFKSL